MNDVDWNAVTAKLDVADMLDKSGGRVEREPPREPGDRFSASQFSRMCPRQEALRAIHGVDKREEIDLLNELYFGIGDGIHQAFQDRLLGDRILGSWRCRGCGRVYGSSDDVVPRPESCNGSVWDPEEKHLRKCPNSNWSEDRETDHHLPGFEYREVHMTIDDPPVGAHPDAVVWCGKGFPPEGVTLASDWVEPWELKSATENVLKYGLGGSDPWRKRPWHKHVRQLQVYLHVANEIHGNVDRGRIVYVNKAETDPSRMLVDHRVERDEAKFRSRSNSIAKIDPAIESGDASDVPMACSTPDCDRAEECPVSEECWKLEGQKRGDL